MEFEMRPVEDGDYSELAAMLDRVMTQGTTAANLRLGANSPMPVNRNVIALDGDGTVVGWSMLQRRENELPGWAFTTMVAHPDRRREGVGSGLFEDVVTHSRSVGIVNLRSRVKDSEPGWLEWARSKGFAIDRHSFRSSIALAEFDGSVFEGPISELEASGIVFTTLAEIGDTPENRRRYYEADCAAAQDIPGEEFVVTWPEYEAEVFKHPEYRPEGAFLALDGGLMIGVAHVMLDSEHDRMDNAFTGVTREYRGRGIAQALKALTISYAKETGVSEILTENDSKNAPMLAVNGKLGYKRWPGVYSLKAAIG